jgi:hypothetical protein
MAHAKLSPSASVTWMTCPGSVSLPPDPGANRSSDYAADGTAMHAVSELCLTKGTEPEQYVGQVIEGRTIKPEFVQIIRTYVEFCRSLPGLKRYEVKVSLEEVIADCFGTADCVAMRDGHLTVADLKTGAGNRVEAENNTQLLCYALGAFLKFDALYDFETVTCVIVQPPLENISTWTVTREQILAFADELVAARKRIDTNRDVFVISEKGCKWCRGKSSCPAQRGLANEAAAIDFRDTKIDLTRYLEIIDHLRGFADAVENAAKETLLQGGSVPGWKVVEGRRTRAWKDEAEAETYLNGLGYSEMIYSQPKLLTVAQMEKALKKEAVDLDRLIESKTGNPTLAKESDKRSSLNKFDQAAKDFAN